MDIKDERRATYQRKHTKKDGRTALQHQKVNRSYKHRRHELNVKEALQDIGGSV